MSQALAPLAIAPAAMTFDQVNALFVDDDPMLQMIVPSMLTTMGCKSVTVAKDGHEALALLSEKTDAFQVMITDYLMPNVDGVELIQTVREKLKLSIPIVGCSGSASEVLKELVEKTTPLGVKVWLPKPFRPSELRDALVEVLTLAK